MDLKENLAEKIIIALDVAERDKAWQLVEELPEVRWFKIGLELFTSCGPSLISEIKKRGHHIFLDLKLHDIPNTVAGAVRAAVRHGVSMLTLHISGGRDMMLKAKEAAGEEAQRLGVGAPKLIGVTVLTSLNDRDLESLGFKEGVASQVLRLAQLAQECHLDGCVCSPQELPLLKPLLPPNWLFITPGIRPTWASTHDQKRVLTPAEALKLGASFLVVGRAITGQPSPRQAFLRLIEELKT